MKILKIYLSLIVTSFLIGLLTGGIATVFGRGLLFIGEFRQNNLNWLLPALALAGLGIVYSYTHFGESLQKGMSLVFKVSQQDSETIPLRLIPLVLSATWMTHLFGGSAGREGVAVQIGATLSHRIGRTFPLPNASKLFLTTGIAAGFAGLFQTPIAACFFALEILKLKKPSTDQLTSLIIAAFTASRTSHLLGLEKFSHPLVALPNPTLAQVLFIAVMGLCFGTIGQFFAKLLRFSKVFWAQKIPNPYTRIFWGGLVLSVGLWLFHTGRYAGLGTNLISASLQNQPIYPYDWILKALLTIGTLSVGFQGGEVTPLFAIGASSGVVLANFLGLPAALGAALGYSSVFGSATQTWIAPIFIGFEVFGPSCLPFFILTCSLARFSNPNASIYS